MILCLNITSGIPLSRLLFVLVCSICCQIHFLVCYFVKGSISFFLQLKSDELGPLARENEALKREHTNLAERVKAENFEQSKNLAAFESAILSIQGINFKIKEYVHEDNAYACLFRALVCKFLWCMRMMFKWINFSLIDSI